MLTRLGSPIDSVIDAVIGALRSSPATVLTASPGSGKTTRVPLALLQAGLPATGLTVLLQPRSLAARAVARYMAALLGDPVGERIGYQVRFERARSARTRILVVTEGVLTRWLVRDPFLEEVGLVIVDELHERSVDVDLCCAFLRELLEVRADLRVLLMSATLDAAAIRRTRELLAQHPVPGIPEVQCLHGSLSAGEQDQVLTPGPARRVVLATNIAETSLTVPAVTAVVDSGLVKRLRFDAGRGLDRLAVAPVSRASADQRAGRAGRVAPGRVLRLWSELGHARLHAR